MTLHTYYVLCVSSVFADTPRSTIDCKSVKRESLVVSCVCHCVSVIFHSRR